MASVAYYSHPDYDLHVQGSVHPERPERTAELTRYLAGADAWAELAHIRPEIASLEHIELVHERRYVEHVAAVCEGGGGLVDGRETGSVRESFDIGRRAVGAVTGAIDRVLAGESDSAFCAVRPPGHHAMPTRAMGFCLFNNVAVGARYALDVRGLDRVLIVDWDFHHGNGTQTAFWSDGSVMFFSAHCSPAYPYTGAVAQTGEGPGAGCIVNAPLLPGSGNREYLDVYDTVLAPAAERFRPDLVLISAGFDAHRDDPLSLMGIDTEDFGVWTDRVRAIADKHCGGRIVSALEGGYDTKALSESVEEHLRHLLA